MSYQITVDWDELQSILIKELNKDYIRVCQDMDTVKESGVGFVFSKDAEEDLEMLENLKHSLAVVMKYYGSDVDTSDIEEFLNKSPKFQSSIS